MKKIVVFLCAGILFADSVFIDPTEADLANAISGATAARTIYFNSAGTINLAADLPTSNYPLTIVGADAFSNYLTLNNQSFTSTDTLSLSCVAWSTDIVKNGSTLTLTQGTFSGDISGTGQAYYGHPSVSVTVSGTCSFSGITRINSSSTSASAGVSTTINSASGWGTARVEVGNSGGSGATNRLNINDDNTAVDFTVYLGSTVTIASDKTITMNAANLNRQIYGVIAGSGNIAKTGALTTFIENTMTYTGSTTVSEGTLSLRNGGNISSSSSVFVDGSGTLSVSSDTTLQKLTGSGNISSTATITASNSDGNDTTFSGKISGTGALTKSGAGKLTLSGANSYSGLTTISAGTLSGGVTNFPGAITNNSALEINESGTEILSKNISGTGTVTYSGAGTVTITGTNNYSGNTALTAGALVANSTTAFGDGGSLALSSGTTCTISETVAVGDLSGSGAVSIASGKILSAGGTGTTTLSGNVAGDGGFTKTGSGSLTLTGTNSWGGATTISAGTLVVNTGSLPGNVTNNGALTFNQGSTATFSSDISGSGSLTKTGSGNLTLSGSNSYSGTTTVSAGTLTIGSSSALGSNANVTVADGASLVSNDSCTADNLTGAGSISIASGKTITSNNSSDSTFSGNISGSGGLTKTGSGTLTLSGTNSYSGTTTISAGTLSGSTTSIPGNITNNGTLTVTQSDDGTLSGQITGTGALNKEGLGNVTLSGTNSMSGATTVSAGTLTVTGSLENSAVTIASGATVRGIGTLGATTVNGLLFPGQSIGTMTIAGNYTQSTGSTLSLEVAADGTASKLDISGTATIQSGATLQIIPLAGDYVNGTVYTLMDASGGISGTFSTTTVTNEAELDDHEFRFNYTSTQLQMVVGNLTTTCHKTPAYLDANLANLANHFSANLLNFRNEQRVISWDAVGKEPDRTRGYVLGDFALGRTERRQYMIGSSYQIGGALFGIEHPVSETLIVGGCGFYSRADSRAYNKCGTSNGRAYSFGGYVQKYWKLCTADAFFIENIYHLHPHRQSNGVDVNHGHQSGCGSTVQGKVIVNFDQNMFHARPLLGLRYMYNRLKPYTEKTAKANQYHYSSQRFSAIESMLGVYMWGDIPVKFGVVSPLVRAVWTKEFVNQLQKSSITKVDLSDPTAEVKIQTKEDDIITLGAGLNMAIRQNMRLESIYEANFNNKEAPSQEVRLGFSWLF